MGPLLSQISVFLPVFLASPTMYAGMVLILGSPFPRKRAFAAWVGSFLTAIVIGIIVVDGEAAATSPKSPSTLSAVIDILIGAALVFLAARQLFGNPRKKRKLHQPGIDPSSARPKLAKFAFFGIILTVVNPTSLTAFLAAGKLTVDSGLNEAQKSTAMLVAGVYYTLPFLIPLILSLIAPSYSDRFLALVNGLLQKYGRYVMFVILVLLGINLIVKGVGILD